MGDFKVLHWVGVQEPHVFQIDNKVHFLHLELVGLRDVDTVDGVSLYDVIETLALEKAKLMS